MLNQNPDAVMARLLAEREGADPEAVRARQAGFDMGNEDKEAGMFDDTPPCGIVGDYAVMYQSAYREVNPAAK